MSKTSNRTQDFVPIKEIRDGVVILNDNSMRAVLIASSINFSLKSSDEQIAILSQYQSFLNSLDFSLQIYIQSRHLDITPYLKMVEERLKEQTNELLKIQIREYTEFIKSFTSSTNVMAKTFFVVVPYSPSFIPNKGNMLSSIIPGRKKPKTQVDDKFEESRSQLEQRVGVVEEGLNRTGVRTQLLKTDELIELYFKIFNPGESNAPTIQS